MMNEWDFRLKISAVRFQLTCKVSFTSHNSYRRAGRNYNKDKDETKHQVERQNKQKAAVKITYISSLPMMPLPNYLKGGALFTKSNE